MLKQRAQTATPRLRRTKRSALAPVFTEPLFRRSCSELPVCESIYKSRVHGAVHTSYSARPVEFDGCFSMNRSLIVMFQNSFDNTFWLRASWCTYFMPFPPSLPARGLHTELNTEYFNRPLEMTPSVALGIEFGTPCRVRGVQISDSMVDACRPSTKLWLAAPVLSFSEKFVIPAVLLSTPCSNLGASAVSTGDEKNPALVFHAGRHFGSLVDGGQHNRSLCSAVTSSYD